MHQEQRGAPGGFLDLDLLRGMYTLSIFYGACDVYREPAAVIQKLANQEPC